MRTLFFTGLFACVATIAFSVTAASVWAAEVSRPKVALAQLHFGTAVVARELLGGGKRFAADTEKVWAHATLSNPGEVARITMVWSHEGVEMWRLGLEVGRSPRWRTWSRRSLRPRDAGRWTVEVLDASGVSLGSAEFEVLAPPVRAALGRRW